VEYISNLTLSYFRSHKTSKLALDGRPVVVFGKNGTGKTNILEAVSLFSPGRGLRRATADDITRNPEAIGWKIEGKVKNKISEYEIVISSENGDSRRLFLDGKKASIMKLSKILRIVWLVPSMDRLWIEGSSGRRKFLDRLTLSYFPEHAEISLSYEKAMRERNRLLKEKIHNDHWYSALEIEMAKSAVSIQKARLRAIKYLSDGQNNLTGKFPKAELLLVDPDQLIITDEEEAIKALEKSRPIDMMLGRTSVGPHKSDLQAIYEDKLTLAKDCSTGEQKAILISIILANARSLAKISDVSPIVLLDEVSAHLDKDRQAALYDEICGLRVQAWMTGTEPELFSELKNKAQFIEVSTIDGVSELSIVN
jgi:DNA replication and repair protein RecF